ncbi:MAG: hypothetical protein Q7T54_01335, partial [Candidatus Levybacteria bacterium]|nr:hypothetical protein [Candidatus Levybacteria bacterium]
LKLSIGFLSIFYIVKGFLVDNGYKNEKSYLLASIIGGLFYIFSPISIIGWDKVIFTHDQFFLNPLIFLLVFLFLKSNKIIYLFTALLVTFIFSHNFSFGASPPLFAFYPLALLFLIVYTIVVKKRIISWWKIGLTLVLFILIHSYHLFPLFSSLFKPGSDLYANVFTSEGKFDRGLSYFSAVSASVKVTNGLFHMPQMSTNPISNIYTAISPFIFVFALMRGRSKLLLLTAGAFLIVLFFAIGNITTVGIEFYKSLFNLPGFSMFRNYFGQWQYAYIFFYSIFFSLSLSFVFNSLNKKIIYIFSSVLIIIMLLHATPFLIGDMVNKDVWQSDNLKLVDVPDPHFTEAMKYVKDIKQDSKVLVLPLSDPGYQIVAGKEKIGVYEGPALIAYLAGKRDFAGTSSFGSFNGIFAKAAQTQDYGRIKEIFANYNIGYVFYNSDPLVYEKGFPGFPYEYARSSFPQTQEKYKEFIAALNLIKVKSFGENYHLYRMPDEAYLPHIYAATEVVSSSDIAKSYILSNTTNIRKAFAQNKTGITIGHQQDVFQAQSSNPFDALIYNNHLHNHAPYIARRMDELVYPLVLMRERFELSNKKEMRPHVDTAMLLLSKRLYELKKWGNIMEVNASTSIIPIGDYYMSWERSLESYKRGYAELLTFLKTVKNERAEINAELVKIDEQLKRHQALLIDEIHLTTKSSKDKEILMDMVDKTFYEIYDTLSIPVFSSENNKYSIILPESDNGAYELHIENIPPLDKNAAAAILTFNNKQHFLTSSLKNEKFIKFPDVSVSSGSINFTIDYSRRNYMQDSQLNKAVTLEAKKLDFKAYSERIEGYEPGKQYLITFEYMTNGDNFVYSFLDIKSSGKSRGRNSFFKKNLNSMSWKSEQTIIASDPYATAAFIEFANNHASSGATLSIRNFNVTETLVPNVLFVKDVPGEIYTPKIVFQRINPVAYKIIVKDAKKPYFLVFSDAYDKNWKIVLTKNAPTIPIKFQYFDGQIKEGEAQRSIPGLELFNGWTGPYVADKTHMVANGYANGWYITPDDTESKSEYTLVLVYKGQQLFYIGGLISFVSLLTLIITMIFLIRKR